MKKTTSKIIVRSLALTIAAATIATTVLVGCNNPKQQDPQPVPVSGQEEAGWISGQEEAKWIAGGWTVVNDDSVGYLPEDVQAAFQKAMEKAGITTLNPVAYIGSQVVAGVNYAILCKELPTSEGGASSLKMVKIYKDLQGEASVLDICDVDLGELAYAEGDSPEALAGGWTITEDYVAANMDAFAETALRNALESAGVTEEVDTIALLGSQVVGGTNYCILCHTKDGETSAFKLFYVYDGVDGTQELLNAYPVNPAEFSNDVSLYETEESGDGIVEEN